MTRTSRKALVSTLIDAKSGQISRRVFLERTLALGVGSSAALTLLEACGGSNSTTSSGGPITLKLWDYFDPVGKGYLGVIDAFMKANPNIKIQRTAIPFADLKQKIIQGAASKQLPDIVVIDNPDHSAFSSMGILADITSNVNTWGQSDQYYPGPWKSTTWQGKNYGVPNNSNCLALYYNKDMFKAAGVTPPTTWDELHSTAKKLTKTGVYGFSMSLVKSEEGTFQFLPFLWQSGADLNTLSSASGVNALQYLVSFVKEGLLSSECLNWTQQDAITQFIAQKAAMCMNGPWNLLPTQQGAKFSWGVVPLPQGQQPASILGGENWAITATSKYVNETWNFLKFTQTMTQLRSYIVTDDRLPSRKDLASDPVFQKDPNIAVFVNSLQTAKPRAYGPNYPKISNAVQQAFQSAISGQSSPSAALNQASQTINPLLS